MENTEYTLTAAVSTDVPVFYEAPHVDEFVLPDAPPAVEIHVEAADMTPAEDVVETLTPFVPHIYFQDVYNGFGFYAIDDGDPLTDDAMTGEWAFRRPDGTFGPASEWDGVLS